MGLYDHNPVAPNEGREFYGVILGPNKEDQPKVENGQFFYKVWVNQLYGKYGESDVKPADIPFIPAMLPPGMAGGTTSAGALSVGQLVKLGKDVAQGTNGFGTITGLIHTVTSGDTTMLGSTYSLMTRELESTKRDIRLPPDLKTVLNDNGVEVTELVEKGLFSLKEVFGIASHGAQIDGVQMPQITNILTAKGGATNFITSSIAQAMPGSQFSLGDLLNIMPAKLQDELFSSMPKEVTEALTTTLALTQKYDTSGVTGGLSMAKRIDPTIFLANAVKLLKDIEDVDELMAALKRLMTDASLGGLESTQHIYKSPSTFGEQTITIDSLGNITSLLESAGKDKLRSFSTMLGNITSPTGTLFDQVSDLPGMIDRMKPEVAQLLTGVINSIPTTPHGGASDFVKGGAA